MKHGATYIYAWASRVRALVFLIQSQFINIHARGINLYSKIEVAYR